MTETRYLTVQADYHKIRIPLDEIVHITTEGRKIKITRSDGSAVRTNRSLRDILAELPPEQFSNINRGIIVSLRHVQKDTNGVLIMKDGTQFKRRVRSDRLPAAAAGLRSPGIPRKACPVEELSDWIGAMPIPICVLELVYKTRNSGAEFLLRYCNSAMEELEHIRLSQQKDQPLGKLPGIGSAKWLAIFADVAITGNQRVIEDIWPGNGQFIRMYCFQPQSGYCALALTDLTRENNLVQEFFSRK